MLQELQKLQAAVHGASGELSSAIGTQAAALKEIAKSDAPLQRKAFAVIDQVRDGVSPLLAHVGEIVNPKKEEAKENAYHAMGNGSAEKQKQEEQKIVEAQPEPGKSYADAAAA
jgi:hypothetical protein